MSTANIHHYLAATQYNAVNRLCSTETTKLSLGELNHDATHSRPTS